MKVKYLFLIICLCFAKYMYANNIPTQANLQVVPVSPNAASLGKFGAIPVGHYTGTANISVPIHEINLDGKSFPINLSYHSSGIKVAQEASCVGLGWALQGYGCIVKDVKGWDDFAYFPLGYYFDTNFPIPDSNNDNDVNQNSSHDYQQYHNNTKDGDPDLFHFNFGNYSGTMFFDKVNTNENTNSVARPIIQKVKENIVVEYNINSQSWKIIDGDGFCYYFNTYETTDFFQRSGNTNFHPARVSRNDAYVEPRVPQPATVTAWYLDSIVSPKRNKIIFEYKRDNIYTLMQMQETVYHLLWAAPNQFASYLTRDKGFYVHSYSMIDQVVLSKIKTKHQTIEFITDDRFDIQSSSFNTKAQKISGINVTDATNDRIKTINLEYEYTGVLSDYKNCRLFLKKMSEIAGNESHNYDFTYVNNPQLPDKHSNMIDSWGYYNGQATRATTWDTKDGIHLSEYTTYIPEFDVAEYDKVFLGRSEVVSHTHIKAGMLSSIKYPTGLVTNFVYEPNYINNGSSSSIQKEYVYMGGVSTKNFIYDDEYDEETWVGNTKFDFTLTESTYIKLTCMTYIHESGPKPDESYFNYCVALMKESGDIIKEISVERNQLGDMLEFKLRNALPPGNYKLVLRKGNIETQHKYWLTSTVQYERTITTEENLAAKGAGVRIKQVYSDYITDHSTDNEIIFNTKYEYTTGFGVNASSSGLLMSKPFFAHLFTSSYIEIEGQKPTGGVYYVKGLYACGMSSPYNPFSTSALGSIVGYNRVYEKEGFDDSSNRGIEYIFHNDVDEPLSGTELYFPGFPTKPNLNNGLLKSKIIYNEAREKIKETIYEYGCDRIKTIKGVKVHTPIVLLEMSSFDYTDMYIKFYDIKSERWLLHQESTTDYSEGGEAITANKQYSYSLLNHLPSRIDTESSDGTDFSTLYKYPTDFQDATSLKMRNKNMINEQVEMLQINDGGVIGGQKTQYVDTLGMILQKTFYKLHLQTPVTLSNYSTYYKPEYTIDQYNNHGNILQTTDQSGLSTAYLWGYNNAYPIAKVQNSTYSAVNSILNGAHSFESSYTPNMLLIDNLRSRLPAAMVTTYTYKLLRGMQTQTSPLGIKTSYEYDTFGRLQSIRNNSNERIQSFKYNYKK